MKKTNDAPATAAVAAQISEGELRGLLTRVQKGETIKANGKYIRSVNDFRRAFSAHPDLAAIEGRDEEAATDAEAGAERDREREATLARIAELEGYLDANQKSFAANQASIEALQAERDDALTARDDALKAGKDALALVDKAEKRVAELEKEVQALKAAASKPAEKPADKPDESKPAAAAAAAAKAEGSK